MCALSSSTSLRKVYVDCFEFFFLVFFLVFFFGFFLALFLSLDSQFFAQIRGQVLDDCVRLVVNASLDVTPQRGFGCEETAEDDEQLRVAKKNNEITRRTLMLQAIRRLLLNLRERIDDEHLPAPIELWRNNEASVPLEAMHVFGDTIKALLCTPVTSCASERVFSLAGQMQDSGVYRSKKYIYFSHYSSFCFLGACKNVLRFADEVLIRSHLKHLKTKEQHLNYFREIARKIEQQRHGESLRPIVVADEDSDDDVADKVQ